MSVEQGVLERRFLSPGPKRILALDGAGAGVMVTAGLLAAAEAQLRRLCGRSNFRLCDYFDLIGASSTGALLAAPLALGATAAEAGNMASEVIAQCFLPDQSPGAPRFDAAGLDSFLADVFGDKNIRSPVLKTGLAIFAKRTDASGFETFCNAPPRDTASGYVAAPDIMVRSAVRASMGAPVSYETAAVLHEPTGQDWAYYSDAASSGLGNPSLALLRMVALGSQGFEWHTGPDRILMLSIGDGASNGRVEGDARLAALDATMRDAKEDVVATMQSIASVARLWRQHVPEGGFRATLSPVPLLHFQRMDLSLDPDGLAALGARENAEDFHVMAMTAAPEAMERLRDLGVRAGRQYFEPGADKKRRRRWDRAIFPRRFDLPGFTGGPREAPKNKLEALGRAWGEKAGSTK